MAFDEESSSDQLLVAIGGQEFDSGLTNSFPPLRDRTEMLIREAPTLGPNSSIEDSDDDIGAVIGFGPESSLVPETQKLWGASGVELATAVFKHGEDRRVFADGSNVV